MTELPPDIHQKITTDFGTQAPEAIDLLNKAISTSKYVNDAHVVRCVIHLAEKDLIKLTEYIEMAKLDPRDVMFLAEYTNHAAENPTRIHDFSKPFGKNG
ncbi:MAG TPA: hypothetical protein VD905_21290 [Flavobacteriales bacterium]|nr:hypothetical protein [Flavobacteriales bacterium]